MNLQRLSIFLCLFAPLPAALADFQPGQSADLVVGGIALAGLISASDIAVDTATQKVFVADGLRNRILRFSSTAALQNGGLAEAVFGAADFMDQTSGTSATKLKAPTGVCVDSGGRLWVADRDNHRVLRFDNALTAPSGSAASVVLGQPNFTSAVTAAQANRMNAPQDVEMDSTGRLWVVDSSNNRVLRFDNAASRGSGVNADGVLGQATFTASIPGTSETELYSPTGLAAEDTGGGTVRLWVVDWYNSRIVGFDNAGAKVNGAPANKLLGQLTFNANLSAIGQNRFNRPYKAAVENGGLWVGDTGNYRVLYFAAAGSKSAGGNADLVLGQQDFTSFNPTISPGALMTASTVAASAGRVWIGDVGRVVRHDAAATKGNGTDADGVLGRNSLASPFISYALDVQVDSISGKLFVVDSTGNRVLRFPSARSLTEDSVPEAVLGQPDLTTTTPGTTAAKMRSPSRVAFDVLGNLWVADSSNHRVLRFANAATAPTGTAAVQVLGQANFTDGASSLSATRLNNPSGLAAEWGLNANFQLVVRRLWVSDRNNHRVLRFESPLSLGNGGAASGVFGAANLTTAGTSAVTASGIYNPGPLTMDAVGRLWVSDAGHNRVLRFDSAGTKANNAAANGVLLQSNFTSSNSSIGTAVTGLGVGGTNGYRLYVTRSDSHDVIWFDDAQNKANGAAPDGTLGGTDRVYAMPGTTRAAIDPFIGRLWIGNGTTIMRYTPELESRITGFGFNDQNRFSLTIHGTPGEIYDIRSSTDLSDWSTVERTDVMGTIGAMLWTASSAPNGPKKFYRLQVP